MGFGQRLEFVHVNFGIVPVRLDGLFTHSNSLCTRNWAGAMGCLPHLALRARRYPTPRNYNIAIAAQRNRQGRRMWRTAVNKLTG